MNVVIINKSDSTGGAAIVSRRLMEALRAEGCDARMLVAEKLTDSPYISTLAPRWRLKTAFFADRLRIAFANGFNRSTLFKLDAAAAGINLSDHPWIKEADAIIINWINQGVLSLRGIEKLLRLPAPGKTPGKKKKILWVMHDMWNFTGLCHHADRCEGYSIYEPGHGHCGFCPMLGHRNSRHDLSYKINQEKEKLYADGRIHFIAVSNWLAERARESRLLKDAPLSVIPNAFPMPAAEAADRLVPDPSEELLLIFGAARLDDPIKDFPMLINVLKELQRLDPQLASHSKITLFGDIKDRSLLSQIPIPFDYHGIIRDSAKIADLYRKSHIVISTSRWETLPGTLIEGQAYGCWPIAFPAGGQPDIITHTQTGWLATPSDNSTSSYPIVHTSQRESRSASEYPGHKSHNRTKLAQGMAMGIIESARIIEERGSQLRQILRDTVESKFSAPAVARSYLTLLNNA